MAKRTNTTTANTTTAPTATVATPVAPPAPVVATPAPAPTAQPEPPTTVDLSTLDISGALGVPAPVAKPAKPAKTPGVAPTARTRAYYAGMVIGRHGHAAGVTPQMVDEVDGGYGTPNRVESEICLRNAWHALRGFATAGGVLPVVATPAPLAAPTAPANA